MPTSQVPTTAGNASANTSRGKLSLKPWKKIKEAPAALVIRWREKFLPDFIPGKQVNSLYAAKALQADTQGALRSYRLINRSSLCFILEDFPFLRLCVCLGMSWAMCWVWGCCSENKTLQYMTCFSGRHAELCWESIVCHWHIFMINIFMN